MMTEQEVRSIMEKCKKSSRKDISIESVEGLFSSPSWVVRKVAIDIFGERKDIPVKSVNRLLADKNEDVRLTALSVFIGREDVPSFLFLKCINSLEN